VPDESAEEATDSRAVSHGEGMHGVRSFALRCTGALAFLVIACGGKTSGTGGSQPPGSSSLAISAIVGTACTPQAELSPTFPDFQFTEVSFDTNAPECGGAVCLVNHFQGRTTCPYGQGNFASATAPACTVPGTGQPVTAQDPSTGGVLPQCTTRRPANTVYCSCRCANPAGRTDDGADYCACPSGFACAQVISEVMPDDPTAGAYCVKDGTQFDTSQSCVLCNAQTGDCP
jgi:hypothetical protein